MGSKKVYEARQNKLSSATESRQLSAITSDDLTFAITRGVMAATQQNKSNLIQGNQSEHEENEWALNFGKNAYKNRSSTNSSNKKQRIVKKILSGVRVLSSITARDFLNDF